MNVTKKATQNTIEHIKKRYHEYRHTENIDEKGSFFSQTCMLICRPTPSYAASSRDEIVGYLKDAQQGKVLTEDRLKSSAGPATISKEIKSKRRRGVYTIRPLQDSEFDFGDETTTAPVGMTPVEMRTKATDEGWIGMRVDLWDQGGEAGLLVKVHYWWRCEERPKTQHEPFQSRGGDWMQCLHDIVYIGPKDGTEGSQCHETLE
ncbi:hypothetical protein ACN47E_009843 [Coniothyrium glycines]